MKISLDITGWRALSTLERCWGLPSDDAPQIVKFVLSKATDVIVANVTDAGANIEIFPDRSSGHARLRSALGA